METPPTIVQRLRNLYDQEWEAAKLTNLFVKPEAACKIQVALMKSSESVRKCVSSRVEICCDAQKKACACVSGVKSGIIEGKYGNPKMVVGGLAVAAGAVPLVILSKNFTRVPISLAFSYITADYMLPQETAHFRTAVNEGSQQFCSKIEPVTTWAKKQ
eukprot:TRINITY_DN29654_c0_g1_i1.p1 TRINITY_DN29654_c0_g1~~TRINITY_DN29654_c0_g1_i1.p1  ORF type:complete len:159 (-),score=21.86 TRINITY_DN29654_c0_g1_i1:112-588(-)